MQEKPVATPPDIAPSPLLSDSWFRSQLYGLHREADESPRIHPGELADLQASCHSLQQLSHPVVDPLARHIADKQSVVVLSDARGQVLRTVGNVQALEKAQRYALEPGNIWSESGRGTNAIGTALAIEDACEIQGSQHFLTSNRHLYCAAMPLQGPDGNIAGVLDISGPTHFSHARTLSWVKTAALQIEHQWVKQHRHAQQWLMSLHAQAHRLDSAEELLLVFSDNLLMSANRQAMRGLNLSASQLGKTTFEQLFPDTPQSATRLALPLFACTRQQLYYRLDGPARTSYPRAPVADSPVNAALQGAEAKMLRLLNAGISLCIHGETGSGKEYVSRALHQQSRWREGKFIAINCAALPEALIESELFGYQPGAFTGASKNGYRGKIRDADGGVLFLDEIGDMPLALQTRLLRVLQEKEVAPLGSSQSWPVNFAVVCATHRDLQQRVAEGLFREDLLWRLQEFSLTIPPLRHWPALEAFIRHQWRELGGDERRICLSSPLIDALVRHPWPGNVRQLRSLMKVLLALADNGDTLNVNDLPASCCPAPVAQPVALRHHDDQLITATLARFNGNVSKAARALGIARSTLYRRAARTS